MSQFQSSKKQRPTSVSSRHRSAHSITKATTSSFPSQPSYSESKPDFKVYQSGSVVEDGMGDHTHLDRPTEDYYHPKPRASSLSHRTSSFSQNLYGPPGIGNAARQISEPSQMYNMTDPLMKEGLYSQSMNEDGDVPPFGMFPLSENPEMNEVLRALEMSFARMGKRLETNEHLIHLHDEMQRLNHMERRNMRTQEQNAMHEVNARIAALEHKMNLLEEDVKSHRTGLDDRLEDFTGKIEQYLERFVMTTTQLGQKFDTLAASKDKETNTTKEKAEEVEEKVDKIAEETRERLKTLYDTVENVGKLASQTATTLEDEKYNVRRLEEDFLRLLNTSKDLSQSTGDVKWLSDELFLLKARQMSILNYLNLGPPEETEGYEAPYGREKYKLM